MSDVVYQCTKCKTKWVILELGKDDLEYCHCPACGNWVAEEKDIGEPAYLL